MPLGLTLRKGDSVELYTEDGMVGDIRINKVRAYCNIPHVQLAFNFKPEVAVVRGGLEPRAKAELVSRKLGSTVVEVSKDNIIDAMIDEIRILRSVVGRSACVESESTDSLLKFVGKKV